MVKQQKSKKTKEQQLNLVFRALADPTRRKMLQRLAKKEAWVGDLADPFAQSLPAISKHLGVLEDAQLITRTRQGRRHRVKLSPKALQNADKFLTYYKRFWNAKLNQLEEYLHTHK